MKINIKHDCLLEPGQKEADIVQDDNVEESEERPIDSGANVLSAHAKLITTKS